MSKRQKKTEEKDDFGAFEKHTKGIGMKLLLKMGFKPGQGLGKDAEGRAEPVQIKLRPRGVGIGFSDGEEEVEDVDVDMDVSMDMNMGASKKEKEGIREPRTEPVRFDRSSPEFDVMTLETSTNTIEIIDMTKPRSSVPLASFLSDLKTKKRQNQATLNQKQFEMESVLRKLERNIEEIERECKRVQEIKRRNEIKRIVGEFVSQDYTIDSLCDKIETIYTACVQDEFVDNAVLSVLIPILQSLQSSDQISTSYYKLKRVLPQKLYDQVIYNLWWPGIRHPHFTAPIENVEDWEGVMDVLRCWAPVLSDEFLVLFIGNQILMPRVHSLLSCDSVDDRIIAVVWGFLVELKFNQITEVLRKELITWLNDRISKVQPKSFIKLLREFTVNWSGFDLEVAWLKRCERLLQRDLVIDPSDQDLLPIECILSLCRADFVSCKKISHVLASNLIPQLKKCVHKWMKSSTVDFEEVADWYVAWKEVFSDNLLGENDGELMDGFGEILSVINECI